jgi:hypothetical protein
MTKYSRTINIRISRSEEADSDVQISEYARVTISGDEAAVERAIELIQKVQDE